MSDGGRDQRRGGGQATDPKTADVDDPKLVPREHGGGRGWPLTDPMRYVQHERREAASQIQRSLKAWRKGGGEGGVKSGGKGGGAAAVSEGSGAPLPDGTRKQMEQHLGAGLGHAKIHTGSESARAAEGMNARAFTVGEDVHFGAGEFAPGTKEGERLIAHELTHVVQAQQSGVQRKADAHDGGEGGGGAHDADVSHPDEPAEKEADAVADHVSGAIHADGGKEGDGKPAGTPTPFGTKPAPKVGAKLRPGAILRNDKNQPTGGPTPPTTPGATPGAKPGAATPGATPGTTPATTTPPPYDAKARKSDELWTDCEDSAKRTAAVAEMTARGYNAGIVAKILAHDNGKTMRPFVSCASEDNHTQDRHILDGAGTIPDKKRLALRVLRNDPPCPGKAGAFDNAGAADKAVAAALKTMAWPTLRDKIAKGAGIEEDIAGAVTGEVLSGVKVTAKELPPYAHPMGEGGRPLYAGDPEFDPEMKKLLEPKSGKYYKTTPAKGKTPEAKTEITLNKASPLTNAVTPTGVHVRIVPDAGKDGGWFIHSAWPY